jgi:hypothetical protein
LRDAGGEGFLVATLRAGGGPGYSTRQAQHIGRLRGIRGARDADHGCPLLHPKRQTSPHWDLAVLSVADYDRSPSVSLRSGLMVDNNEAVEPAYAKTRDRATWDRGVASFPHITALLTANGHSPDGPPI